MVPAQQTENSPASLLLTERSPDSYSAQDSANPVAALLLSMIPAKSVFGRYAETRSTLAGDHPCSEERVRTVAEQLVQIRPTLENHPP